MWIDQKYAVPDEQQDTIQELQISFRSGEIAYLILINKSMGFSQSLSRVQKGGDNISEDQIPADNDILNIKLALILQISLLGSGTVNSKNPSYRTRAG